MATISVEMLKSALRQASEAQSEYEHAYFGKSGYRHVLDEAYDALASGQKLTITGMDVSADAMASKIAKQQKTIDGLVMIIDEAFGLLEQLGPFVPEEVQLEVLLRIPRMRELVKML